MVWYPAVNVNQKISNILFSEDGESHCRAAQLEASPLHAVETCRFPCPLKFMVIQSASDMLTPVEETRDFVAALEKRLGREHAFIAAECDKVCYLEVPRARHAFDIMHDVLKLLMCGLVDIRLLAALVGFVCFLLFVVVRSLISILVTVGSIGAAAHEALLAQTCHETQCILRP